MSFVDGCAAPARTPWWRHPYFAAALMIAGMFAADAGLEAFELSTAGRLAFGLLPVVPSAYLIWAMARWIRSLDELQRKIQMDALALAYTIAILVAVTLNFLHKAGFHPPLGWEDGWAILVFLYAGASAITARRYQ